MHIDGGMRDYLVVPAAKLHRSARLSFEQLALVETLGIGAHAVARAKLEPGEWALVVGAGPIGLTVMQFARLAGAHVIALDVSAARLAFCRTQAMAEHTILASPDTLEQLLELTNGDLPTAVFDATGNAQSMTRSFDYVANSGRLTFVGLVQSEISFNDPAFHRRELTLLATRNALASRFHANLLACSKAGQIDTQPWITHRAASTELITAFPTWLQPEAQLIKGVVAFG